MKDWYSDVMDERIRQCRLWGTESEQEARAKDRTGDPYAYWLQKSAVLSEETGEVAHAILERDMANLREECVQVAAVAVSMVQMLDGQADGLA